MVSIMKTSDFFDEIRERIQKDEVRMTSVDGISFYSATDIDNLIDALEEEYTEKCGE